MRRLTLILSLFLYLLPALGVSVQVHYCGEEVESVSIFGWQQDPCCCGDTPEEPSDCCDNKLTVFHFTSDQQAGSQLRLPMAHDLALLPDPYLVNELAASPHPHTRQKLLHGNLHCHAPPLFVQHSQWLI